MSGYQLLSIVASILAFSIGTYLFQANRESRFHRIYALGFFATGLFSFFLFGMSNATTQSEAWLYLRLSAVIHLIPPLTLHAIFQVYQSTDQPISWSKRLLIYGPFVLFIIIDGGFPELTYYPPIHSGSQGWMSQIDTNAPLQIVNMASYFLCIGFQGWFLVKLLRDKENPARRRFALFVTITYLIPIFLSAILVFVVPYFVEVTLRLESVFALFVCLATLYCLRRLNIFDLSFHLVSKDIIQRMSNFLLLADSQGVLVDVNPKALALLGPVKGRPLRMLMDPDDANRILSENSEGKPMELQLQSLTGQAVPAMVTATPIIKKGEYLGQIVIGSDLSRFHNLIEEKKIVELELKALVRQMNPHFLSNSINGLQHFILQEDEESVNTYITQFARLMRSILHSTEHNLVPLRDELDILDLYLDLEGKRFTRKLNYEIEVAEEVAADWLLIPPMMIQPFVENALWHGLMHKEGEARLILRFATEEHHLRCEIIDNGIGRELSEKLNQQNSRKHHSVAIRNIRERVDILNRSRDAKDQLHVEIQDLYDDNHGATGTMAVLQFPLRFKHVSLVP